MCGIIYSRRLDGHSVNRDIKRIYFSQSKRGKDGYGFINITNGGYFRTKYEHEILKALKCNKSSEILFHHRNPTSTSNTVDTAHPICSNGNYEHKYYLVHNGIIRNSSKLYDDHVLTYEIEYTTKETWQGKNGELYFMFNDSESLLHELALMIEGKKEKKDFNAIGSMAFIMLQTDKDNKAIALYYGRNFASPLKVIANENRVTLTSEGQGVNVEPDRLFRYDYDKNEITYEDLEFQAIHQAYWQRNHHNDINYGEKGYNDDVHNAIMDIIPNGCLLGEKLTNGIHSSSHGKRSLVVVENDKTKMYDSSYDNENEDLDIPKKEGGIATMSIEGLIAEKEEALASIDALVITMKNTNKRGEIIDMNKELEYWRTRTKLIENELEIRGSYAC